METLRQLAYSLPIEPTVIILLLVCVIAASTDLYSRRIPNWLIAIGLAIALFTQYLIGDSYGLSQAAIGIGVAFGITVVLMIVRVLAAGDSKLMLVVGAALGAKGMTLVLVMALVLSGVIGLLGALISRRAGVFGANISIGAMSAATGDWDGVKSVANHTAFKVPFALPVLLAIGLWIYWYY